MQRAIVFGGCGFIGSYVVRELLKNNYNITVLDNLSSGKRDNIESSVTFIEADIRKYAEIENVIQEGDIIFHLAALTSVPGSIENPLTYHETNIRGTYNVFEAARTKKAKGIIFSSSAAVYGNQEGMMDETKAVHPENPYAFQKVFGEQLGYQYASLYSIPFVTLRYFNVYGKGNHEEGSYAPVTARFLKAKREGRPLPLIGDGGQTRDFVHVTDVAHANVLAIHLIEQKQCEVINVCSGTSVKIIDIATMVGGELEHLPPRQEIKHSCGKPSKAKDLLNFQPSISLEEGLRELLN